MRLIHPDLQSQVILSADSPAVIAVEAPEVFYRLVRQIYAQAQAQAQRKRVPGRAFWSPRIPWEWRWA